MTKEEATKPKGIHAKLLEVQKRVTSVQKNGYNNFHKYAYVTKADVLNAISEPCTELGLAHYATQTGGEISDGCASVVVDLVLIDTESDQQIKVTQWGYAQDAKGDKAIYKATTGAVKYAYLLLFGLSTDEDPENPKYDSKDDPKPESKKSKFQPKAKGADPGIEEHIKAKRSEIMSEIGYLFGQYQWTRKDFELIKGIQSPEQASLDELDQALKAVKAAAQARQDLKIGA